MGIKLFGKGREPRGSSDRAAPVHFAPIARRVRTILPEKRSALPSGDLISNNLSLLLDRPAASGAPVNEWTALNVSAVTACVRLLADMVAKLPLELFRTDPNGPVPVTDHPIIGLIGAFPSEVHTSFELRQLMGLGKGLGGNGYARVYRDAFGDPRSIQWLEPRLVTPNIQRRPNGEMIVTYFLAGTAETLTRHEILHVREGITRDGVTGISPIRLLRDSIGTSISQTEAAGKLMRNGTMFPGILTSETIHKKETIDDARAEWERNTTGGNLGRTPILNGSFKFQQTNGMSMVDAEFLGSRRYELQEIARFYGIPAFLIGDSTASTTWGSGIEQQTLGFLNFCLDAHLVAWEQSLAHTLLTTQEQKQGFYFRFDRDELANVSRADTANYFTAMRNIGVYSANDLRRKLDEPLIAAADGGDDYGRPFNASGGTPQEAPVTKPNNVPAAV